MAADHLLFNNAMERLIALRKQKRKMSKIELSKRESALHIYQHQIYSSVAAKPEPKDLQVLVRLPEPIIIALDEIVGRSEGKFKSRNDLINSIIAGFIQDLRHQDEARK